MNRVFIIIICLICMGCTSQAKNINKSISQVDMLELKIDSLINENSIISQKVNTLNTEVEKLKVGCDYINSKLDESEDLSLSEIIIYIILFLWILISSIGFYKFYNKQKSLKKRINELHKGVGYKLCEFDSTIKSLKDQSAKSEIVKLQKSIENLYDSLSKIENDVNTNKISITTNNARKPEMAKPKELREAYFGMVKGDGFFNDIYQSEKDESRFKITYISDTEVSFVPFDLNKIRFFDGIEKAVYYTGEVSLKDAVSFEVLEAGYAVRNGEVWDVKDKVKIVLK